MGDTSPVSASAREKPKSTNPSKRREIAPKPPRIYQAPSQDKLDALGTAGICDLIGEGKSLRDIATETRVSVAQLIWWIAKEPERSARVRETRALMCAVWDDDAIRALVSAPADPVELVRAREIAQHLRWRMSHLNRAIYGDKVTVEGNPDNPVVVEHRNATREALMAALQALAIPEVLTIEGKAESGEGG